MVFPEKFLWGASNSGFQFEMGDAAGVNVDAGSDWYLWVRDNANIQKGVVSGDLPENGVDYWSLYEEDHNLARELGLNAYRVGIEWSRIFPKSTVAIEAEWEKAADGNFAKIEVGNAALKRLDDAADKTAVNHYRTVIEDLRSKGFRVFVCLNHFTVPLWIHNPIAVRDTKLRQGPRGWADQQAIVEFAKYAAYVAWKIGDVVDEWATFNEPMVIPETGYLIIQSGFPPALNNFRVSRKVAFNLLVAHARAYDAIKKADAVKADEDSASAADVGVIHNVIPAVPFKADDTLDVKAADFLNRMHNHFLPQAACSGWVDSNLNGTRDKGEIKEHIGNRLDWLGVNYYARTVVRGKKSLLARLFAGMAAVPDMAANYGFVCKPNGTSADGRPTSDFGWEIYPEGLLDALKIMQPYGRPLYVMENGLADAKDMLRAKFIIDHLKVLEKAINMNKIDVRGYFHWALTDNYEWAKGFGMKFGLYEVDLKTKKRTERKSTKVLKDITAKGTAADL
ncbi:MAG: beta-galactosidase BgaS [Candidatus Bathyarchaeota archaeon]|nr:beta-galactosidase BgaS [Candidatus Bathyarchaeota archaeon]